MYRRASTAMNYLAQDVNSIRAERPWRRYCLHQKSLQGKEPKGSSVILFGVTPWCSQWTKNQHDAPWDEMTWSSQFVYLLRCNLTGQILGKNPIILSVWNVNWLININVSNVTVHKICTGQIKCETFALYQTGRHKSNIRNDLGFASFFIPNGISISLWQKWKPLASCHYPFYR